MTRLITSSTSLENLKREAKRWLNALRANDEEARARLRRSIPNPPTPEPPTLRDVQHALALEFGLPGWTALKQRLADDGPVRRYDRIADALVDAYRTGDASSMRMVHGYFGHMRSWDATRRYIRLDLGKHERPEPGEADDITLADARCLVARGQGFEQWDALVAFALALPRAKRIADKPLVVSTTTKPGANAPRTTSRDWDEIVALMQGLEQPALHAHGQMTDAMLEHLTRVPHIASLDLEGSGALGDDGVRHLARLSGLRSLNLSGCAITDRGLGVLRELPLLEELALRWTRVTDDGLSNVAACEHLRKLDLSGTRTGDETLRVLEGKGALHDLRSGNAVTDRGLASLHELPVFKTWHGGEATMRLLGFDTGPNFLMLRGSFTNAGLATLVGLDGLFALNLDSDQLAVTGAGLAPLASLPRLGWLAFDATDDAMPYIAALPHLRFLMCQDTSAGDDGFVALSRSRSIEYIWGRRCHNLRRRGFVALAGMPALRALSVSCLNVDDAGLSALPSFRALRELMPMDVPDEGYRHIGRCERLEALILMYCRETTDGATEHITGLSRLSKYFASYTRITDRTPELLAGMPSLENVELVACPGLTAAGVAALARLPRLRELRLVGMPHVTGDVARAFGPGVDVSYSP